MGIFVGGDLMSMFEVIVKELVWSGWVRCNVRVVRSGLGVIYGVVGSRVVGEGIFYMG